MWVTLDSLVSVDTDAIVVLGVDQIIMQSGHVLGMSVYDVEAMQQLLRPVVLRDHHIEPKPE